MEQGDVGGDVVCEERVDLQRRDGCDERFDG